MTHFAPHCSDSLVPHFKVCQQLRDVCQLRVVWLRAYTCSTLPLPPIPPDQHEGFDHRLHLVRATQLNTNWTSSHPSPKSRRSYSTRIAAIWLFRSRFLVTFTYNDVVCWDLDNDLETPLWKMPCPLRPIKYEAAEMLVEGSRGIVFAYTTLSVRLHFDRLFLMPIRQSDHELLRHICAVRRRSRLISSIPA